MSYTTGTNRLFSTLIKVIDKLRGEAPSSLSIYNPPPGNQEAVTQARSRGLLHLYLKARFGIADFDKREQHITDGPDDGGVDAFFIESTTKTIFAIQSKFRATAANFASVNLTPSDLLKIDISRMLAGETRSEQGHSYNEKIRKKFLGEIKKVPDIGRYKTVVVLLGNTTKFTTSQLRKLIDGFPVEEYPYDRCYRELLFPVINGTYFTDPELRIEIKLTNLNRDTHLDYDVKANSSRVNIKLLFAPTQEIGRIMSTYRNTVLRYNPRSYLELGKNPVNQAIYDSVVRNSGNEFALFNNGVTVLSDLTDISSTTAKRGTAQVILTNPQIVNGGQTAYTLGRIYEECAEAGDFTKFKGKEVLLRIVTFSSEAKNAATGTTKLELIGKVSLASNSQTKIEESDRRSNDKIQIDLQNEFFSKYGRYYVRKKGEFTDGLRDEYISSEELVDRDRLLRVALACKYRVNQARASTNKFYSESALSETLQVSEIETYAFAYETLAHIESLKKTKPRPKNDKYLTSQYGQALRYGQYAVVAVCANRRKKDEKTDDVVNRILQQWIAFETSAAAKKHNEDYKRSGIGFDFVNYYKGSTVNADLETFAFK
jgi:AIPR protein